MVGVENNSGSRQPRTCTSRRSRRQPGILSDVPPRPFVAEAGPSHGAVSRHESEEWGQFGDVAHTSEPLPSFRRLYWRLCRDRLGTHRTAASLVPHQGKALPVQVQHRRSLPTALRGPGAIHRGHTHGSQGGSGCFCRVQSLGSAAAGKRGRAMDRAAPAPRSPCARRRPCARPVSSLPGQGALHPRGLERGQAVGGTGAGRSAFQRTLPGWACTGLVPRPAPLSRPRIRPTSLTLPLQTWGRGATLETQSER